MKKTRNSCKRLIWFSFQIISELKSQLVTDHVRVQVDTHGPDLSDLLRDIRGQYDLAAKRTREESEEWYNHKLNDLTSKVSHDASRLKESQTELGELRNRVSSHNTQIESLRSNVSSDSFSIFCLGSVPLHS